VSKVLTKHLVETNVIVNAVQRIRDDASIVQEARRSLAGALDLLGLHGTAREAVRPVLTASMSTNAGTQLATPQSFWIS